VSLALQVRKNPQHYLGGKVVLQSEAHLEHYLRSELILKNVQKLTQHGLVCPPCVPSSAVWVLDLLIGTAATACEDDSP
jgi:hypothetical protein